MRRGSHARSLTARGERRDAVLTADTGSEKPKTCAFPPIFQQSMDDHRIEHHVVRFQPERFEYCLPYFTILENFLANATQLSISFNRHSCSLGLGEAIVVLAGVKKAQARRRQLLG